MIRLLRTGRSTLFAQIFLIITITYFFFWYCWFKSFFYQLLKVTCEGFQLEVTVLEILIHRTVSQTARTTRRHDANGKLRSACTFVQSQRDFAVCMKNLSVLGFPCIFSCSVACLHAYLSLNWALSHVIWYVLLCPGLILRFNFHPMIDWKEIR